MRRSFRRLTQWLVRLLLRAGLLPASTKTDSDTMGEYKRLMAEKDDPRPGLVLPDPNAPHAKLIRRVRLYAQNGAKALGPWLDAPAADDDMELGERLHACMDAASDDPEAMSILQALSPTHGGRFGIQWPDAMQSAHAAYNAPWTVIDGEVYEYDTEKRRRVLQ